MATVRIVRLGDRELRVLLPERLDGAGDVEVEDEHGLRRRMSLERVSAGRALVDGRPVDFELLAEHGRGTVLRMRGDTWPVQVLGEVEVALEEASTRPSGSSGTAFVRAPMPGRLVAVHACEGRRVELEEPLFVIEAMKMENEVRAPIRGLVRNLNVAPGDAVEQDQELCLIAPVDEPDRAPGGSRP